jgi:hypothetical protein
MRINLDRVLARADQPWSGAEGTTRTPDLRTPFALLVSLRDMGIALRPDGNRLYVDITAGNVTRGMLEALRQHKEALLDLVEAFEERAAIAEYCGGLAREDAEWQAFLSVQGEYQP